MHISILTLFPEMFTGPFDYSIVKRAQEKGAVAIQTINIRDFANDAYKSVDDRPYGGGVGMIMRVDVIDRALQRSINSTQKTTTKIVLLDPKGATFTQTKARELSTIDHLILICGHYEGVDERVKSLVDESISIGDYVLTGGEIPAIVMTDAIVRLLPGVLKEGVTQSESFSFDLQHSALSIQHVEYPQYTRPEVYRGMKVPEILLSGDHKKIDQWKKDHTTAQKGRAYRP